ncbi:cysteine--tRNA ligase [Candidatus Bathyarchaeota archaeon]|nr:cysteine--tRNA ligase [Candidatus Bathyarchaeota archaeon]
MPLNIYDTLTKEKREFKPLKNNRVSMFVCGPTVYDLSHIGHARTYIAYDIIARFLKALGYSVFFLMNITDVDDKIINKARELDASPFELSKRMTEEFFKDMNALNISSVNLYAKASEHIPEIIQQIKILIDKGYAYKVNGDVYFDISKFPEYGKLSHQKPEELIKHRIEPDPRKRNPGDFALWKNMKPNEPFWESPWGKGRPGWHIEDTAITYTYFGPQYDIHGGAIELVFPHHEAEIAQGESLSGFKPMVNFWVHTGVLTIKGQKMSKSLKNYITIREALKNFSVDGLRIFFALSHYRSPVDFNEENLKQAEAIAENLYRVYGKALSLLKKNLKNESSVEITREIEAARESFYEAMKDDFNTPQALAVLINFSKKVDSYILKEIDRKDLENIINLFKELFYILGLFEKEEKAESEDAVSSLMDLILKVREEIRKRKDWKLSDEIREKLNELGFIIEDTPQGAKWIKIKP